MTRIVSRPIEVIEVEHDGTPHVFIDRGDRYVVTTILDRWIESGDWTAGEGMRHVYRILTEDMAMLDLELFAGKWTIYKVWD